MLIYRRMCVLCARARVSVYIHTRRHYTHAHNNTITSVHAPSLPLFPQFPNPVFFVCVDGEIVREVGGGGGGGVMVMLVIVVVAVVIVVVAVVVLV